MTTLESVTSPRKILVAVAWPYANGSQHLGHIAGAYLPADVFARYHRIAGSDVCMVSGSDAHGTPITLRADKEGISPLEVVERFHPEFVETWEKLGITFDLFTTTLTDNHRSVVHDIFNTLKSKGLIDLRSTKQLFDATANRFLPDRYVEGTCPHCLSPEARGDQCDNCGRTLDALELIDPRSTLSESTPEIRETEHYFLLLDKLQGELLPWLESRQGWRKQVRNESVAFVREGLKERAITRDIDWGVVLPDDSLGEGKRIYVWFEAVIGYLSATKQWAQESGNPERWRDFWTGDAESYYFIGKDNIPFHAIIWPSILLGVGGLNLPTNVPANQYVTFKGEKASKSKGIGTGVLDYLKVYEPDALRYALASNFPETQDTDLTDDDIDRRINDELVATWGNLCNRVISMCHRYFDGRVPQFSRDKVSLLDEIDALVSRAIQEFERVELRSALRTAFDAAALTNAFLNETEPWKATDETDRAQALGVALQAIANINVLLSPFLPFSTRDLDRILGGNGDFVGRGFTARPLVAGSPLGEAKPLYKKIEA